MASVESIEKEVNEQETATERRYYALSPGVRARREGFGLLFYNSKDAKLTFVRSKALLEVSVDSKRRYRLAATREAAEKDTMRRLIEALAKKGLIDEP